MGKKQKSATPKESSEEGGAINTGVAGRGTWRAFDASAGIAAGLLAPVLARGIWRVATGRSAPKNARSPEINMTEAILWAALAGALAQVVRVALARSVAKYWEHSTGAPPPQSKKKK